MFGVVKLIDFIEKVIWGLVIVFFVLCIIIVLMVDGGGGGGVDLFLL